jgi:hypothetical protein
MKTCIKCGEIKDLSEFNFRNKEKGKYNCNCKECKRKIDNELYRSNHTDRKSKIRINSKDKISKNRSIVNDIKTNSKCYLCGDERHYVLDFHHIVSEEKDSVIGKLVKSKCSEKKLLIEVGKCVLLCSNCHRELHFLKKENELVEKLKYKIEI